MWPQGSDRTRGASVLRLPRITVRDLTVVDPIPNPHHFVTSLIPPAPTMRALPYHGTGDRMRPLSALVIFTSVGVLSACTDPHTTLIAEEPAASYDLAANSGVFSTPPSIVPFTGDAACLDNGQIVNDPTNEPFQLPSGWTQKIITYQGDFPTTNTEVNFDMLTLNETGPMAGRYLYRTHEVDDYAALSRVDLMTGVSTLVAERQDWESFDGLVWTPWRTVLMAEEVITASFRDPQYPNIERGLIYEYDPASGKVTPRPAVGARSHEGMRFDSRGNLYGISESRGIANAGRPGESGAIFKFVPKRERDLSEGTLYALKVDDGVLRTGTARWVKLDLDPTTFDSDAAAQAVGATGWDRPEDIEIVRQGGQEIMYVAVTESSNLPKNNGVVLKIVLQNDNRAMVSNYIEPGVNVAGEVADPVWGNDAGLGFDDPDNVEVLPNGDVLINEDDSPSDTWIARGSGPMATTVVEFSRLLDCGAETTGVYWDKFRKVLYMNSQHAALNGSRDLTVAIIPPKGR